MKTTVRAETFLPDDCIISIAADSLSVTDVGGALTQAPRPPVLHPSISVSAAFASLIHCVNDYTAHWPAFVWLMDLIKLGLITAGEM